MKKNPLFERMLVNYDNLTDFVKSSGIPISQETCRRVMVEGMKVHVSSFMILLKYLGFAPAEIKKMLKNGEGILETATELRYAKEVSELVGESDVSLEPYQEAIIEAFEKIKNKYPDAMFQMGDYLRLLAKAANVDVEEELKKIKRTRGGK